MCQRDLVSYSAISRLAAVACKRWRHLRTVARVVPSARAMAALVIPVATCRMIWTRKASAWGHFSCQRRRFNSSFYRGVT